MNKTLISAAILSALGLSTLAQAADSEMNIGGLVEVEMTPDNISTATVELGLSREINRLVSAEMTLLYEGVGESAPIAAPRVLDLVASYPNPFNPYTVIRYDVAEPGVVDLRIYNVAGALVKAFGAQHCGACLGHDDRSVAGISSAHG